MVMGDSRWHCNDLSAAVEWVKMRNKQGIRCIMDPLGELAKEDGASERAHIDYIGLIESITDNGLQASISVKPTALGAAYNELGSETRIISIANKAWDAGLSIEVDMEARKYVELTIGLVRKLARTHRGSISMALQAYLFRTPKDITDLSWDGAAVRLVKGTYSGDIEEYAEIQTAMLDDLEILHSLGRPFSIGTHDPFLIEKVIKDRSMKGLVEIGTLKGLCDETKRYLASRGWSVAEYVPYGSESQAYVTRRNNYLRKMKELGVEPCP
jgi:proline dehydrogenase